jgi:hypothetical protein
MIKVITNNREEVERYLDSNFSFDSGFITVYIGWDLAKENGASILKHKIDENTYWTFLPIEKRKVFLESLEEFKEIVFNKIKSEIKFHNINPLDYNSKEDILSFILDTLTDFIGYLYKEKIYFYRNKEVYHLDLGFLDFMSWDIIDEVTDKLDIKQLQTNKIKYLETKHIPYLIDAEKNNIISSLC